MAAFKPASKKEARTPTMLPEGTAKPQKETRTRAAPDGAHLRSSFLSFEKIRDFF